MWAGKKPCPFCCKDCISSVSYTHLDVYKRQEQYARVGDYATFQSRWVEFGDERIRSKAIDDRIGCAVMVQLIREGVEKDTWFARCV